MIVAHYSPPQTTPAVNLAFYAAGLCKATIGGFNDWYLPAICEMGYDAFGHGNGCGTQATPLTQNMQSNLVEAGNIGNLSGSYFSSTEFSNVPALTAWFQFFAIAGNDQDVEFKSSLLGVRCVRALTQPV